MKSLETLGGDALGGPAHDLFGGVTTEVLRELLNARGRGHVDLGELLADEVEALRARFTSTDTLERARALFEDLALAPTLRDFLTLAAYPQLSAD